MRRMQDRRGTQRTGGEESEPLPFGERLLAVFAGRGLCPRAGPQLWGSIFRGHQLVFSKEHAVSRRLLRGGYGTIPCHRRKNPGLRGGNPGRFFAGTIAGGQSRAQAIGSAIREIRAPLVGSTITPIVVFLPLI